MTSKEIEFLNHCGILTKWHNAEFSQFTNDPKALAIVKKYLKNPKEPLKDGLGLFLFGANGTGKTLLMNCAFKELLHNRYRVHIISMSSLITRYTAGWYDSEQSRMLNRLITKTQFLGIEEIGKEFRSQNTDLGVTVLDHVLRMRVQLQLPTWVTSNEEPSKLSSIYTEDIASMFREACVAVQVKGIDFRREVAEKNKSKYK